MPFGTDIITLQDGSEKEIPGCYVIFENSRGEIVSAKYSERGLSKWFSDAGMNIVDVVTSATEDIDADKPEPQKMPRDSNLDAGSTTTRTSTELLRGEGESSFPGGGKRWQWTALILIAVVLLFIAQLFKSRWMRRGRKENE